MASSINASTTAGVVTTADTSGVLNIQTAGTTAISINASQAVSFTNSPTVTGGTANGVAYLNGSKVLTTGSALTFSGSALAVTGSISSTGGFTSNTTITAQLDGSDSAGAGPGLNLFNTAFTRGWRTQLSASNNKVDYYFNGAAYVQMTTLNTNGALALSGASTSANGIGITFPATQSASTDANTLDDYEEGTWTPVDASGASLSFSSAGGFYTKIGRQVICFFYVTYPATANASATAIGGLPFTTGNNVAGGVFTGAVAYNNYGSMQLVGPSSVTSFNLSTPTGSDITNANMSSKTVRGSFLYFVA